MSGDFQWTYPSSSFLHKTAFFLNLYFITKVIFSMSVVPFASRSNFICLDICIFILNYFFFRFTLKCMGFNCSSFFRVVDEIPSFPEIILMINPLMTYHAFFWNCSLYDDKNIHISHPGFHLVYEHLFKVIFNSFD